MHKSERAMLAPSSCYVRLNVFCNFNQSDYTLSYNLIYTVINATNKGQWVSSLQQGLAHGERAAVSLFGWHCGVHETDDESQWSACSFSIAVTSHMVPCLMLSSTFKTWPRFFSILDSALCAMWFAGWAWLGNGPVQTCTAASPYWASKAPLVSAKSS